MHSGQNRATDLGGRLQDKLDVYQELGVANVFPDKQGIFQTIYADVFRQALVEAAHWS